MTGRLIIHAPNVHQGGGKFLLTALMKAAGDNVILIADERMKIPMLLNNIKFRTVKPSVPSRFFAEIYLLMLARPQDTVLCFGNLPPLFRLACQTIVFVQNRYLIDKVSLGFFSIKVRLRLIVERFWFHYFTSHADEFIVQTSSMKQLLEMIKKGKLSVRVIPFVENIIGYSRDHIKNTSLKECKYDFIYIASGEPHKNHLNLLKAWSILGQQNIYPSLCLTIDECNFTCLKNKIEHLCTTERLNITNVGSVQHDDILDLCKRSQAVIYPSKFESFGLPLIEARQAGLPILASELDYVRDLLDPEEVFDPESPVSIARAVKRFLGKEQTPMNLLNASQFLDAVFQKGPL